MFDIGWWEFVFVVFLALILIGPKDLPVVLRVAGRWIGRLRMLSHQFYSMIHALEEDQKDPENKDKTHGPQ